jgi:hypothetical protein
MDGLQTSITTNSSSLASRITTVSSTVTSNSQSFATTTTTLSSTVTTNSSSLASSITQTATTLAGVSGSVAAAWGLNVVAGSRVAGIKLLNSGNTTSFTVQADQFYIVDSSGNYATSPFSVVGGSVYINDATIQNLSVGKLTTGTFSQTMNVGNNGVIYGGTMSSYNSGIGFYLGNAGGNQYFSIGNSGAGNMRWDSVSNALNITANINAGSISGASISGGSFTLDDDGAVRIARSGFQNTYNSGDDTRTIGFELGYWTEKNTHTFIDFHSTSGGDNDARIIRTAGLNGEFKFEQNGSGEMIMWHLGTGGGLMRFKNESYVFVSTVGSVFEHGVQAFAFNTNSSLRYKENVQTLKNPLQIVESLRGVSFNWKSGDKLPDTGFIAEEINEVLPHLVAKNKEGQPDSVEYSKVVPYLVEAIKELSAEVKYLKSQLNA